MVHSGDYMVPTSGGETTITKPPLHYWVLCGVMLLGGVGDLEGLEELDPRWLRLPSLLGFWALSWVVFLVLRRSHGPGAGWASAVGILLAPVILHEGPTAEIDPLFASLTGVSLVLLAQGVSFCERRWLVVGGVAGGFALLSKGPPYFLFLAGPTLVWLRHRRLWAAPYFTLP
ncbi:MAG: glycosyltransferase family 39 protein, partial [Thermoanaerobaculia bacterium]